MHTTLLVFHSILRWLVLLLAIIAIVRGLSGWLGKKPWTNTDSRIGSWLAMVVSIQFLIGIVMYIFTSSVVQNAFDDFGTAMGDATLRYWAVEHALMMFIAITLIHIGKAKVKKAATDLLKHKRAAIFYGIALILILSRIPWEKSRLFTWF